MEIKSSHSKQKPKKEKVTPQQWDYDKLRLVIANCLDIDKNGKEALKFGFEDLISGNMFWLHVGMVYFPVTKQIEAFQNVPSYLNQEIENVIKTQLH